MESDHDFCLDMIFEILTRSSMETVEKCRLLSKECNKITHESTFTNHHSRRTNIISGFFIQSMIRNKFYSSFVSSDTLKPCPKLSLNFLPASIKIVASTNQGLLLCQTHHRPQYYVCKPTTKQWQRIPNPKMRYQTLETSMIVIRSNPLHYKIVRFSEPKTRYQDKEFYRYHLVRCELFDSKTWKWKQLEEVKLPQSELLSRNTNVSVNGSLHWLTWKRNDIFAFNVNKESYSMFSLPLPVSEDNKSKDIALVRYKGKLAITSTGREDGFMELWVMENYDRKEWNKTHTVNIEALRRKEPYTRPVAFCNADIALMKEHDRCVTFFNITNGSADRLSLEKNLNHGCFPFQSNFELSDLMGDSASKQVSDNTLL